MDTPKILIVDDSKVLRDALYKWFSVKGFDARVAEDGLDAVAKAKAHKFSVIIMDVDMPRMNGTTAIREIHTFDPGVPIIILSGSYWIGDASPSEVGAVQALRKPIGLADLEESVRAVMRPTESSPAV